MAKDHLKGRPATLDRWPGERHDRHRAMLLFAMQTPVDRSNRAVSRAMGISEGAVRGWRRSGAWNQRVESHGADADQYALDLYREHYLADFGKLELPHVAARIVRPLGAASADDPAVQAANEARQRVAQAIPAAQAEAEQATAQAVAEHRRDTRKDAQRHIKLVDGALGVIARKLSADEVRVTVRDIPPLLECRDRLVSIVNGAHDAAMGPVVESARVQHAKSTGGDVVEAMHEDAMELVAILGALRSTSTQDANTLAAQDAQAREATA